MDQIFKLIHRWKCHGASFACKKFSAKQTNWIVAQTLSLQRPKMMGALRAPAVVLKKDVAEPAKAVGGGSWWIEVTINNTLKIIISAHLPPKRLPLAAGPQEEMYTRRMGQTRDSGQSHGWNTGGLYSDIRNSQSQKLQNRRKQSS